MASIGISPYQISDITGYTNRVHWDFKKEQAVLLIHDMQNYYLAPLRKNAPSIAQTLIENIKQLLDLFRRHHLPVIYTYYHPEESLKQRGLIADFWGAGLPPGDEPQQIIPELAATPQDLILTKYKYSAFFHTNLFEILSSQQKTQIVLTGVFAHGGCYATALDAFIHDLKVFFVADGVADLSAELHTAAVKMAASACAQVVMTEQITKSF